VGRVVPNAPQRLPERRRLLHSPPPWVGPGALFFVTIGCTPRGQNQPATPRAFAVLQAAFERSTTSGKIWTHLLLAMPDHLHALLAFPLTERMEGVVRDLKRYVARTAGLSWQDGFFDHRLRSGETLDAKADYIRLNPVRAGLIAADRPWPYGWQPSGLVATPAR